MKLKKLLPVFLMTFISLTAFFTFSNLKSAEAAVMLEENISAKVAGNSLTLSWKAPDDIFISDDERIIGYRVGYSTVEPELWYDIDSDKNWTVTEVSTDTHTYTITGLKFSTDYYYSIACVCDDGSSQNVDWAYTQKITTANDPLSESFATPSIYGVIKGSGNTLGISWDTIKEADSYKLAYSSDNKTWIYINNITDSFYDIKGLDFCTKYYVKVVVMKDGKEASGWSDVKCVATKTYAAPSNIKASVVYYNYLTVSWNKVSGVNGYKIAYSADNKTWTYKTLGNVSSYKIINLKQSTKYGFKLLPLIDGKECGKWSSVQYAVTKTYAPPTNIKASSAYYNYLTLSWSKADAATGYKIAYSTDNKNWTYKNVGNVLSYKITGLKYNTKYYFKVASLAVNNQNSKWSSVQTAFTKAYAPPSNVKASVVSYNFLTFSWSKADAVTSYKVAYSVNNKVWTYKTLGNVTSYKITGLKPQTKYYFKVVSLLNNKECSKWSGTCYAVTNKYLNAPANIKISKTCNTATISWSKVSGANGYAVYLSKDSKNWTYQQVGDVSSYKMTKLVAGQKYYYKIAPLKNKLVTGKHSKVFTFTTSCLASAAVKTSVSSNAITASWGKVKGASNYRVYSSKDGKKWKAVSVGNKTSYKISGLLPKTKYFVRVVPMQNNFIAAKYNTYSATTSPCAAPSITGTSHSTSIDLKWNKSSYGNGYRIFYSTNGIDWIILNVKDISNHSVKNLASGTTYFVKIAVLRNNVLISKTSVARTITTLEKNYQFIDCPACVGGECHSCGGDGKCYACHGTGHNIARPSNVCNSCVGGKKCKSCGGSGKCMGCGGRGTLYVDVNA